LRTVGMEYYGRLTFSTFLPGDFHFHPQGCTDLGTRRKLREGGVDTSNV
jgi:hypothetical protein